MSYEKQTWVTGETITADKLNHMETGIENSSIITVKSLPSTGQYAAILDMKWSEIYDLFINGHFIVVEHHFNDTTDDRFILTLITEVLDNNGIYKVNGMTMSAALGTPSGISWFCTSEDDYPYIIND